MRTTALLMLVLVISLPSCGEEVMSIDREMRRSIDTLFRAQRDLLMVELDSLCVAKHQELYPLLLDSVVSQREQERENILKGRQ